MKSAYGKKLAEASLLIQAIQLSTAEPFLWASGYYMPVYNDNRMLLSRREYRKLIAEAFTSIIKDHRIPWDYIAGTSTSGIPHATTLADMLDAPLTYVREKPKGHGLRNRIEGLPAGRGYEGKKVILIEDLISTGGSSIRAVQGVRDADGDISCCLSIFNYGFTQAEDGFHDLDPPCSVFSILTYDVLLETALETEYIDGSQAAVLKKWREDPFAWGDLHGFPPLKKGEGD